MDKRILERIDLDVCVRERGGGERKNYVFQKKHIYYEVAVKIRTKKKVVYWVLEA